MKLLCLACGTELMELPFYNNDNDKFVPSIPFCPNPKCERHGILTVVYKNAKSERKAVQS